MLPIYRIHRLFPVAAYNLLIIFFLIIGGLTFTGCSNDGQVLASYKGGNVTRGDFKRLLSLYQDPITLKNLTTKQQEDFIRNLVIMRIAAVAGREMGLEKTEEYKQKRSNFDVMTDLAAMDRYMKNKAMNESYKMVNLQFLFLKKDHKSSSGENRIGEAEDLLKKLNAWQSDEEIERLIAQKSENPRYQKTGGYLDPLCESCTPNPLSFLTDQLNDVEVGKFVLVDEQRGYWMVRAVKRYTVNPGSLEKVFRDYYVKINNIQKHQLASEEGTDPKKKLQKNKEVKSVEQIEQMASRQAQGMIRRSTSTYFRDYIDQKKKEKNVELLPAAQMRNPGKESGPLEDTTPMFKIGNKEYDFAWVKKHFENSPEADTNLMIQFMHRFLIIHELLKDEKEFTAAKNSSDYEYIRDLKNDEVYASLYVDQNRPDPVITEEDIENWYNLRKENQFKHKRLNEVKDQIRRQLESTKRREAMEQFQKDLQDKYEMKIFKDRLTPGI